LSFAHSHAIMNRIANTIVDDNGRTLILRGVNLGGSSKIPFVENIKSPQSVSFVGRPFPLDEADEHFERLKDWGLTFIRLVITWEAIEHSGPGIYDEAYMDYLDKLLEKAWEKGVSVYMDPHQDVWSRWTGGDGAPLWTLEKLGMDPQKLEAVGAAVTTSKKTMVWPVNYSLYAAATMFTLFFGGNAFAPQVMIEGQSAQDFLQSRYLAAFRHCHSRLKHHNAIAGWGAMNEPHPGFIGYSDLARLENVTLALGPAPSAFQAMLAASGQSVKVPVYTPWLSGWKKIGSDTINPYGLSLFREGFTCPWKQAGVWTGEGDNAKLLRPDHFLKYSCHPARFTDDFLKPFIKRFIENIEEENRKAARPILYFIEGIPHGETPSWGEEDPQNVVNAFHHYDGFTLFSKSFRPWIAVDPKKGKIILGRKKTAAFYSASLAAAVASTRENMGGMPCLLGEFGLPFDLGNRKAYTTGDYRTHEKALTLYYDAIDENLLGATIWNYTACNTNAAGDHWNGEDLSIVSGGKPRAPAGWLRPYPMATAGLPLRFTWDRKKARLRYLFRADGAIPSPTEIFVPSLWFTENPAFKAITVEIDVKLKNISRQKTLRTEYHRDEQRLYVYNDGYTGEVLVE